MVVAFEDPGDEDLVQRVREMICGEYWIGIWRSVRTMPKAKIAPRPRTMPYPQPRLSGGAIDMLKEGR